MLSIYVLGTLVICLCRLLFNVPDGNSYRQPKNRRIPIVGSTPTILSEDILGS